MSVLCFFFSFVMLLKLLHYFYQKITDKTESSISEDIPIRDENNIHILKVDPKPLGKNTFLYPEDEFVSFKNIKKYKSKSYDV